MPFQVNQIYQSNDLYFLVDYVQNQSRSTGGATPSVEATIYVKLLKLRSLRLGIAGGLKLSEQNGPLAIGVPASTASEWVLLHLDWNELKDSPYALDQDELTGEPENDIIG